MSSGSLAAGAAGVSASHRLWLGVPRIARVGSVRARIYLVVFIPVLVLILVTSYRGWSLYRSTGALRADAARVAVLEKANTLIHVLGDERDLTAGVLASQTAPEHAPASGQELRGLLQATRVRTNQAAAAYQRDLRKLGHGATADRFAAASTALAGLPGLRQADQPTHRAGLSASATADSYTSIITSLLRLIPAASPAGADEQLTTSTRALVDLSRAIETTSQIRGRLLSAAFTGRLDAAGATQFAVLRAARDNNLAQFQADAPATVRGDYDQTVAGLEVLTATAIETETAQHPQGDLAIDPSQWWQASTAGILLQTEVEARLTASLVRHSNQLATHATNIFWLTALASLTVVALTVGSTIWIARTLARRLASMRAGALNVARHLLPELLHRLERGETAAPDDTRPPLTIGHDDEISQVAAAFNQVHAEAVRGAIEQADLRRNIAQMFTNLARRSQSLVDRQIQLIDQLEQTEDDPDRLSEMFKLDHLATRMRRNDENLLVLAGENTAWRWSRPVSLVNVLRAAASEVEQYTRVELTALEHDLPISGHAVNDLVHLIAELLENATGYSSPRTKVLVSSRVVGQNLMVDIEDQGIGMAPPTLAAINERLSRPPNPTDVDVSKHMGLYVVSQLAARHRIKVQLRASPLGGVIAMILIPAACLRPQGDPTQGEQRPGGLPAGGQAFAQPRALTAQPTATPPPPRMPAPQRQPYASGSTPPVQFNTGSFPPVPAQYGGGSTPPVPYAPPGTPPATSSRHPTNPPASPPPLAPAPGYRLDGPGSVLLGGRQEADEPTEAAWAGPYAATPVFTDLASAWFQDSAARQQHTDGPGNTPTGQLGQPSNPGEAVDAQISPYATADSSTADSSATWTTPADSGWRAADAAAQPRPAGTTEAGLPRRDPGSQLVPGAAEPQPDQAANPPTPQWNGTTAERHQAAQATRSMLASYRDGIERGRAAGRDQVGGSQ